jgi:hypothetical protein
MPGGVSELDGRAAHECAHPSDAHASRGHDRAAHQRASRVHQPSGRAALQRASRYLGRAARGYRHARWSVERRQPGLFRWQPDDRDGALRARAEHAAQPD